MHVANLTEEELEVVSLSESCELRTVPQPYVNKSRRAAVGEQTEELARLLLREPDGKQPHHLASHGR
jgi:hypothetical protein